MHLKRICHILAAFALNLTCCTLQADCGPGPDGFEPWPSDEELPVASIPADQWYRSAGGWVVAPDWCQAAEAAQERDAAFLSFRMNFEREPASGAIVDIRHAGSLAAMRAAGAKWVLPWRFATTERDSSAEIESRTSAIRAQIETQLSGGGRTVDPRRVDLLMQQTLKQLNPAAERSAPSDSGPLESTALRHEIAHLLFIEGVWGRTLPPGSQYGGDAPDWLDEAAAIAAESEDMTAARRRLFRQAARDGRLIPLNRFVSMAHPAFEDPDLRALLEQTRERAAREGAAVSSFSSKRESSGEAGLFYAQTRGWLDFLSARSGNAGILGVVSDALQSGQPFEEWLENGGHNFGLPLTLAALEAEFLAWAESI